MYRWIIRAMENKLISRTVPVLILAVVVRFSAVNGQVASPQLQKPPSAAEPTTVQGAISNVEKGRFSRMDIAIIIRSHAVRGIPALESQFTRNRDPQIKTWIADALVRLGKKDGLYWNFMEERARQVLQDAPPTPVTYDASGKAVSAKP